MEFEFAVRQQLIPGANAHSETQLADSTLAVSFDSDNTGWMTDSTDTVHVSSGDTLDFATYVADDVEYIGAFNCVSARFDADSNSAQLLATPGAQAGLSFDFSTPNYVNFLGILGPGNTAESGQQFYCLASGTWQNLAFYVVNNSYTLDQGYATPTTTVSNRIAGRATSGSMAVSFDGQATGYFEDGSHSDSVAIGEYLDYEFLTTADAGSLDMAWIGAHFIADSTSNPNACIIGGGPMSPQPIHPGGTGTQAYYTSLFGGGDPDTVTPRATGLLPYDSTASLYTNYIVSSNVNCTFTLMKNNNATDATISTGSGCSGYFIITDVSEDVDFNVGDTCMNRIVVTGTGMSSSALFSYSALLLKSD